MKLTDAIKIILFKILLPTLDVVTDLVFAIQLMTGYHYDCHCSPDFLEYHAYMGLTSLIPPLISFLLHFHHWYHFEKIENV